MKARLSSATSSIITIDKDDNYQPSAVRRRKTKTHPNNSLLNKYIRMAVAINLIPISRGREGRLFYKICSPTSTRWFLAWFLLPNCCSISAVIYIAAIQPDPNLRTALEGWQKICLQASPTDAISFSLTQVSYNALSLFLPGILASMLAALQDIMPLKRYNFVKTRTGTHQHESWLPTLSTGLIAPFMILQLLYCLLPWWQTFITEGGVPALYALGLFAWMFCPGVIFIGNMLTMIIAADLIAARTMGQLRCKFSSIRQLANTLGPQSNEASPPNSRRVMTRARQLLEEYQLVRSSLEPMLFLLTSVSTLSLVMELFYCTQASAEHLVRSLVYLHLLLMNSAVLYHVCVSAEDCYQDFQAVQCVLR
jgi:hypothetical protein